MTTPPFRPRCYYTSPLLTFIVFLLHLHPSASRRPPTMAATIHSRHFNKIFAFGDSFTDTGNTVSATGPSGFNYVSNPPYGMTFFHRPTNRYSDGRLIIDFVAQSLNLPFLPPYKHHKKTKGAADHGVNFAVAGSTAIEHRFFVTNNLNLDITPQSLGTQLTWFEKYLKEQGCSGDGMQGKCSGFFDDALIWVGEIGVNDYAYNINSPIPNYAVLNLAMKRTTGFLEAVLKKGAKYVVVQGLPPTGCLPLAMTLAPEDDRDTIGCVASANNQSFNHNNLLKSKLRELRLQYPRSKILYADYFHAYHAVMKKPFQYGFKEPFKACCGVTEVGNEYNYDPFNACGSLLSSACEHPNEYVNWDGVHLTEAMYKVVADMLMSGNYTRPPFQELFV